MARKNDIKIAAIKLFAERGYTATSTSFIAKKAGVAEGLIFHHFKNKAGILAHILVELSDAYIQKIEKLIEDAPNGLEAILATVRFHFEFAADRALELMVLLRDFPGELIKSDSEVGSILIERLTLTSHQVQKSIERGQKDGSIRIVPAKETAYIIRGMLNGISRLQFEMSEVSSFTDPCSNVVNFCRRSLTSNIGGAS